MSTRERVEVFDTTLRDGPQVEGVSATVEDKLRIAEQLDRLGVTYIEGGWPGANPKDIEFFARAKGELHLATSTLVAFGSTRRPAGKVDDDATLRNLVEADTDVVCIVAKSWDHHVLHALNTTLDEGEDVETARPSVMNVVRGHFRPEFMNRIDEIILFKRLGRAEMDGIVKIQLERVEKLLGDRRMSIALDAGAVNWLADRGYDPVYGARPLKRVIQKELVDPIARKLLAGDLEDGAVIDVRAGGDGLEIGRAKVH